MNLLEYKILLDDKFSKVLDKIDGKLTKFDKHSNKAGGGLKNSFSNIAGIMKGGAIGLAVAGITKLGKAVVGLASDMEQTKTSFSVMLGGSMEKANKMVNQINAFANATPFENGTLFEGAKLLLNFGMSAEKIMPTMKMLGDISGGNADKFNRLSLAYSQARSTGRLMGQDLLQMINAGFNPLQEIAKKTGESMGALKDRMSKGKIGVEELDMAFKSATEKGGKFYQMMDKQSKTFAGRTSTLIGKIKMIGIKVGTALLPTLGKVLNKVIEFSDSLMENFHYIQTALNPVMLAFRDLWTEISNLFSILIPLNAEGEKTGNVWLTVGKVLHYLITPTVKVYQTLALLLKVIRKVVAWSKKMYDNFYIVRKAIDNLLFPFRKLMAMFKWLGKKTGISGGDYDKLVLLEKQNKEHEKALKLQGKGGIASKLFGGIDIETPKFNAKNLMPKVDLLNKGGLMPKNKATIQENKITGSAPKVFNINISKFVENLTVQTTNIQEGATKIKDIIIQELTNGLMDVQLNAR